MPRLDVVHAVQRRGDPQQPSGVVRSEPQRGIGRGEAGVDLWPLFAMLEEVPLLVVRGENSDILEKATATKMVKKAKQATLVTVKGVGHAPSLDEPEALAAISDFLAVIK